MQPDYFQLLVNSSGAGLVTGLFIWYLVKKDGRDEDKEKRWSAMLNEYLRDSISIKRDLAKKIQRSTDVLENLEDVLKRDLNSRSRKVTGKIEGKII